NLHFLVSLRLSESFWLFTSLDRADLVRRGTPYPPSLGLLESKTWEVVPARSLGLKDLLVTSLRTNDLTYQRALKMGLGQIRGRRRDPSLRSGFRQRAPASLTPAKRLNLETAPIRSLSLSLRTTGLKSMDFDQRWF